MKFEYMCIAASSALQLTSLVNPKAGEGWRVIHIDHNTADAQHPWVAFLERERKH
jgi:hypothetical protein